MKDFYNAIMSSEETKTFEFNKYLTMNHLLFMQILNVL